MRAAIIITATTAIIFTTAASADWQFTKWGMTPDQLKAASTTELKAVSGADACSACKPIPLLTGDYDAGSFQFRVLYEFANGTSLSMISLKTPAKSNVWGCNDLFNSLSVRYGQPMWRVPSGLTVGSLPSARWLDPKNGNTVFFLDAAGVLGDCEIEYSPLVSSSGL